MTRKKKKIGPVVVFLFLTIYFFAAVRRIPPETVLVSRWLSSTESEYPVSIGGDSSLANAAESFTEMEDAAPLPFVLGNRFGYVDSNGRFLINQIKKGEVYLSETLWAEYEAEPLRIEIRDKRNEPVLDIENPRGYPCFLDGRIFIIGNEQNALSEIDLPGNTLWTYEFAAPLTCIDAAAGLVLTGSIDGVVEVLDNMGKRLFFFEPGGSRYAVITGCAISQDGSRLGIISGIDEQRFLLLERFGGPEGEYKVIYHEFLGDGFRRPVHVSFVEEDRRIVFEREGGIGVYEAGARQGKMIPLEGEITAIDRAGGQGLFFAVVSRYSGRKELIGAGLSGRIIMRAPFKSDYVFLTRSGSRLFVGGGSTLASFELEKK